MNKAVYRGPKRLKATKTIMELTRQQHNEGGGSSQKLKKYMPSEKMPYWTGSNLEKPETLVVTSTYDGAFTCVLGTYLLEQGMSPCGRPIYNKPGQPLFVLYAGSLKSWVFAESSDLGKWKILWRARSDAMTPLDITENWEAVRPNFYDSNGYPVVNRNREDGKGWDKVKDIQFSSSLFPQLPEACPCSTELEYTEDSSVAGNTMTVECSSSVIEKKISGSASGSESDSDLDD